MRELLGAVAVLLTFAFTASAINLKAYNGNIEFDHMEHFADVQALFTGPLHPDSRKTHGLYRRIGKP